MTHTDARQPDDFRLSQTWDDVLASVRASSRALSARWGLASDAADDVCQESVLSILVWISNNPQRMGVIMDSASRACFCRAVVRSVVAKYSRNENRVKLLWSYGDRRGNESDPADGVVRQEMCRLVEELVEESIVGPIPILGSPAANSPGWAVGRWKSARTISRKKSELVSKMQRRLAE